ncbi:hypothetical protein Sipo8835_24675 [Streptomyces ipomoeae]|uniref:Uncharacterized protein n=2 Tax=Streptomyces ipomoeae TaxID=103232 RepID=L1KYG9_9ACTN|nr:hypothetical protein [Streptomyces ipomoeae]EKX65677.1 hypothetical protein STRIP9103_07040 [Streptomyces ipomoeae 91-03]MDX2692729.1 hypothetical protein [Streptomyces ipomoeae]MDX2824446.1 hypothetical protein [Streptomyces ipomoeae]MDX2838253.1 hypothetical protein [Streptomyces ipomoeae]MDX2873017.1 hypothetical protein [Streptomyces ipomoeae]
MGVPAELEDEVARINALLRPLAKRRVDLTDPDWQARMRQRRPLDEANVREEAETALGDLLDLYEREEEPTRAAIRTLLNHYDSFTWATGLPTGRTPEAFRRELLYLSARDQGHDTRDELVTLHHLREEAHEAGVDLRPILLEVAELSSTKDKYGMGSIRDILRAAAG